ncbi:hypothetical protein RRG08_043001 [Elysia crispata]|uniref:Uncharacterized protein n=1 Tax=Elysia crispata TaxID=231223 RepID=A0AAE0XYE6_9GAST|nr:hypothetical protein RRG08_043001 [Elysia crispata]
MPSPRTPPVENDSGSDIDVDADFEIIGASSVSAPRALFDAENDDVAHREVAEPIVDDGWATPPPDFVPSIPEFTADAGIQLPYDNFSPADFASLFLPVTFGLSLWKKQIEWVISFTKLVHNLAIGLFFTAGNP